jgi:hypothetical protein
MALFENALSVGIINPRMCGAYDSCRKYLKRVWNDLLSNGEEVKNVNLICVVTLRAIVWLLVL